MPETKAHFYDVFCSIFFNQQVLEETEGCSLQAVAPGAAVLIEKKKANGLTAGSGAAETSAVWFQPFQKNTQLAWLI